MDSPIQLIILLLEGKILAVSFKNLALTEAWLKNYDFYRSSLKMDCNLQIINK